ncbi:hypothetical protein ACSEO6_12215, partial [Pseudomonas aeruginosa]
GVGEGHLLHRKALRVKSADFAKSGSLFQSFPIAQRKPAHCNRNLRRAKDKPTYTALWILESPWN